MFEYQVKKELAVLSESSSGKKILAIVAWNGHPDTLDLRKWRTVDGELQPAKGITLTDAEAESLYHALSVYLQK